MCCRLMLSFAVCHAVLCCVLGADWWESRGEPSAPPLPPDSIFDSVLRDLLSPPRPSSSAAGAGAAGGGVPGSGNGTLSRRISREGPPIAAGLSRSSSGLGPSAAAAAAAGQYACSTASADPAGGAREAAGAAAGVGGEAGMLLLPRCAPPGSLLCRLALHALVFGNARAVAALWQRFVVQVSAPPPPCGCLCVACVLCVVCGEEGGVRYRWILSLLGSTPHVEYFSVRGNGGREAERCFRALPCLTNLAHCTAHHTPPSTVRCDTTCSAAATI